MIDPFDLPRFIEDIAQRPQEHQAQLLGGFMRTQEGSDRQRGWMMWPTELADHLRRLDDASTEDLDEALDDLLAAAYPGTGANHLLTQNN